MFSEDVQGGGSKGGPPPTGPLTLILNSEEAMFADLRDLNFRGVGHFLSKEAKKITAAYEVNSLSVYIILATNFHDILGYVHVNPRGEKEVVNLLRIVHSSMIIIGWTLLTCCLDIY